MTLNGTIRCPVCSFQGHDPMWPDYFCPRCGALHEALYRREHRRPSVGRTLTTERIIAEYRRAGIAVRDPGARAGERG